MYQKRGFTLIELLVVVLIIGILFAVALPQYQKAVQKSRNAQLKTLIRSIVQAQKAHYMAAGALALDFASLDLDLPLDAPVVSAGIGNTCNLITAGPDSIRAGKNFHVVLNNHNEQLGEITAVWTDGKYKCTGFGTGYMTADEDRTLCMEANSSPIGAGDFCEKIENGVLTSPGNGWRLYTLP